MLQGVAGHACFPASLEAVAGFDAFCVKHPLRKARLEAGAGLEHFPLQSIRKSSFGGWSLIEALSFTNPLRKARLEAAAGLRHFPLQSL